ncbi:glycosyltransferase family 25 protein [Alcanivorax sp.]|jgi:glycosyl transferase family 25|uniref:glycosyltransferase family 25 protein n=1 Tax=Alcanivorax sp. TaxID=1872427 RepID=UPI0025C2FF00|nr:glycosyltransferase family 25 protein [Alcanivorax sp.]
MAAPNPALSSIDSPARQQAFDVTVIAMKHEIERRNTIENNLSAIGLRFRFIDGLNYDETTTCKIKLGYRKEMSVKTIQRELTAPEIGCFVSHREAWIQASRKNRPTLILESDALLDSESVEIIERLCNQAAHHDLVMLNYHKCIPSFWKRSAINSRYSLVKFANRRVHCLASYLVSPEGARKLADQASTFYLTADDYATGGYIDKDIDLFAVFPRCVSMSHLADQSTIEEARQEASKRKKNPDKNKASLFRKIELYLRNLRRALLPPSKGL